MNLATVLSADTRNCTYRQCPRHCRAVRGVWCRDCNAQVEAVLEYRLKMTMGVGPRCYTVCIFEKQAAELMGCSATDYMEFIQREPAAMDAAEELLMGQTIEIETKKNLKRPEGDDKVVNLRPGHSFTQVMTGLRHIFGAEKDGSDSGSASGGDGVAFVSGGSERGKLEPCKRRAEAEFHFDLPRTPMKKGMYKLCAVEEGDDLSLQF